MCPGSPASLLCMNFWKIQQGIWTLASLLSSGEAFLLKTRAQLGGTITAEADAAATARIFHGFSVKPGRERDGTSGPRLVPVSESFCSPLAPTVKGSFLLVARSLTSFPPSLRSSFGVLVRETLSLS